MSVDPQRLITDPESPAKLRADLELSRTAGVSGLDLAAGATRLRGAIAAEPAVAGSSSAAGTSVASKLVIGALALGGVVGLWVVSRGDDGAEAQVVASTSPAGARETVRSAPPSVNGSRPDSGPEQAPVETVDPVGEDASAVDELVSQEPPAVLALPERRPSMAIKRKVASRRMSEAPDHRREAELVAKARRSLTGDPERAWQLTKQLGKEFPRGVLAEERDAIAIRALVALGRTQDAQRLAKTFLAEHGEGPHADAIRRAVGL